MRTFILGLSWLAVIAASGAAAPQAAVAGPAENVTGVTITQTGSYTGTSASAPAQAGQQSPTGTVGRATDWEFVSDSHDVAAKVGTQFGIEFQIAGAPAGGNVTLHLAVIFPPVGIHNPNTGVTLHEAKVAFPNMKIGALSLLGYGFDNEWEIVPGLWTLQVWYQDQMLAAQSFTIAKAN